MPRIKDLRRFLKRRLDFSKPRDWVSFKVISAEDYKKRHFNEAHEVEFEKDGDKWIVTIAWYSNWFRDRTEKEFNTFVGALNYLLDKFPPKYYVYYYSRHNMRAYENYYTLRDVLGYTIDESYSWRTILARCMEHLNGRELIGFKVLKNTSKKCWIYSCNNKAEILVVFEYRGMRYGLYYCRKHWEKQVEEIHKCLLEKTEHIRKSLLKIPPIQ